MTMRITIRNHDAARKGRIVLEAFKPGDTLPESTRVHDLPANSSVELHIHAGVKVTITEAVQP